MSNYLSDNNGNLFDPVTNQFVGIIDPWGNEQLIPTVVSNPVTGRNKVSVADDDQKNDASKAAQDGRIILPRSYGNKLNSGTKIVDIAGASLTITSATQRIATPMTGGASALRLLSGANVDITGLSFATPATAFSVGFWAYKPTHQARSSVSIYLSNAANYTNFAQTYVVIEPGLNYYAVPLLNFTQSGTGFNQGDTLVQIRFRDLASAGDYPVMAAGSDILIGDIYLAKQPKAVWVWGFDDCKTNLYTATPAGTEITGGDGVSKTHSFASFIESYGWRGTAYAIGGLLGASGFTTAAQLRDLQDNRGWTVGSHSWAHPNSGDIAGQTIYGLRNLGPAGYAALSSPYTFTASYTGALMTARNDSQAVRDDVEKGMAICEANGLTGYLHFATPQSATDFYVQEALRACGIRTLRGMQNTVFSDNKYALANGAVSGGIMANNSVCTAIDNMPSSVLLDSGGTSDANVEAYINNVIALGAVGTSQLHNWDVVGTRNAVKHAADYLKQKEAQGLITIMTAEQLYQYQRNNFRKI